MVGYYQKAIIAIACAVATGGIAALVYHKRHQLLNKRSKITEKSGGEKQISNTGKPTTGKYRPVKVPIAKNVKESTSFANFQECVVQHMFLDLQVDFSRKVLSGTVTLNVIVRKASTSKLVLDTSSISVSSVSIKKRTVAYTFGATHPAFGTPLIIELPEDCRSMGAEFPVDIVYETASGENCSAVQWLPAQQTAGKDHPFLFTQCQAIHCRSMIPCQDAPCVKATYNARIRVPSPLVALMSAVQTGSTSDDQNFSCIFSFKQDVPISSYLIALAVGNLESRDVGPRSRVWSEPSVVDFAAYEFAETESFIRAAEEICGDYVWGRYDLLMLPPSFPYGGMENPCLTFVTPTLLAGDRSMSNVVAHEIAHSWSGNLVTNATWSDFWMNEGFTVFIERKIVARVCGKEVSALKSNLGWTQLQLSVDRMGKDHEFTKLHIKMNDVDPDDSFSSVPYEKGCAFLTYLEQKVGGPSVFEPFLKAHVLRFQYGTVSWDEWKQFFELYFLDKGIDEQIVNSVDWDTWILGPGMPPEKPVFSTKLLDSVSAAVDAWLSKGDCDPQMDTKWIADQKVVFLDLLIKSLEDTESQQKISKEFLRKIDARYDLSSTKNSEILFNWFSLRLKVRDEEVFDNVTRFLIEQGRMKYVRPLYRELNNCGENGRAVAVQTFQKYKLNYHVIAQKMIGRDLKL